MVLKRKLENNFSANIVVGEKIDKKPHLSTIMKIGETAENKKSVYIQANLTSKKDINLTKNLNVESVKKYEYIEKEKIISESYETPKLVKSFDGFDKLANLSSGAFSNSDIRAIVENNLFPFTILNYLMIPSKNEVFYVNQISKQQAEIIKIKKNLILLKEIVDAEKSKGNVIYNSINTYLGVWDKINNKLSIGDLRVIEYLYLINSLDAESKTVVIDVKNGLKTLKIYQLQDVVENTELHKQICVQQEQAITKVSLALNILL